MKALYLHRQETDSDEHRRSRLGGSAAPPPAHASLAKGQSNRARPRACQRSPPAAAAGHPALRCLPSGCHMTSALRLSRLRANTKGTGTTFTQELLCNSCNLHSDDGDEDDDAPIFYPLSVLSFTSSFGSSVCVCVCLCKNTPALCEVTKGPTGHRGHPVFARRCCDH